MKSLTGRWKNLLARPENEQDGEKTYSGGQNMNKTTKSLAERVAAGILANSFSFGCHIKPEPYDENKYAQYK